MGSWLNLAFGAPLLIDSIDVLAPSCLPAADWQNWSDLQRSHACFESPSLRPEYTKLLIPLRPNLRVAVMRYHGASVGFFPYVVETPGTALPAGRWLMSFQAIVCDPRYRVDTQLWLRACQVRQICFDRMVCPNDDFADYSLFTASSPVVDLRNGYDDYVRQLQNRGSQLVPRLEQKKRRVMRDCSTIDLADESESELILERVVSWRRQRNREILAKDFLSQLWTRQALQEFCRQRDDLFRGRLFVLRFGGRPVAALVGLQSGGVLECVMTAFDPELRQYSPGLLLFYFLLRNASRCVIHSCDSLAFILYAQEAHPALRWAGLCCMWMFSFADDERLSNAGSGQNLCPGPRSSYLRIGTVGAAFQLRSLRTAKY